MQLTILKKITAALTVCGAMMLMPSCKKSFLEENLITTKSLQDYQTPLGLDDLSIGMYQNLKFHFNYEWAYTTTNYGVDEFCVGGDRTMQFWNSYDANLNSLTGDVGTLFASMYANINSANILIENVPLYYGDGANRNTRLGEGYFMRAFDYFKLVKQFGGVLLKLTQTKTLETEFGRSTAKETYAQVIKDFTEAYNLLPPTPAETGRITKYAAAHFLAKAYLFRASELYDEWNSDTKTSDLDSAIKYSEIVITSGRHSLASNFAELWNFTTPDGPNERLPEIILAAQFSNNVTTQGRYGNQVHLYYPSVYQNLAGMVRDLSGGREFQRLRSTDYALDVFDRVNDSRFWKSFKTRYVCNNPGTAPKWDTSNAATPAMVGQPRFTLGQESILYIVNNAGDTRYTGISPKIPTSIRFRAPHMFVRYFAGQAENMIGSHGNYEASRFVALSKFMDGSRNGVPSQFGQRDGILARLAETYLIAAEAYGRKGNYDQAVTYINMVRDRAAYKAGEDRAAYTDGGVAYKTNPVTTSNASYSDRNTYYESNNDMAVTTASTLSSMHLNSSADIFNSTGDFYDKLGAGSNGDKFIAFILNERSRELMGELMRWEDLARTKTLVKRCNTFNDEARPVAPKHYLRPIPQSYLDANNKDGRPLTAAEKTALQNPGW